MQEIKPSFDKWIQEYSKGRTFADIGGLWDTKNERITVAAKAGASNVTMIDCIPLDDEWWKRFYKKCELEGIKCDNSIHANIDSPNFIETAGMYDVVHCSGVIYHCPNPLLTVSQLAKITKDILILGSTRIPSELTNSMGSISLEENAALFVPSLNEIQRSVINKYFQEVGGDCTGGISHPVTWDLNDYGPWWYIFTDGFIEGLLKTSGLEILDTTTAWNGRIKYFLTKKIR